jgi:hypothetical protein
MTCHRLGSIVLAAATIAVAGCGSDAAPDLSGAWSGALPGTCSSQVVLDLSESDRGVITGAGSLVTSPSCGLGNLNYSISGEHDHPFVSMVLAPVAHQGSHLTLSGTVRDADVIDAMLGTDPVTLTRSRVP